jgi:hypothetical protein
MTDNQAYYIRRIAEENRRARVERDPCVRHVHETLESLYRKRLQSES